MLFFYLLVNYHYYYCVSLDTVDIVKLGICVVVGKPILIVQPVRVLDQHARTESSSLDLQYHLMKY